MGELLAAAPRDRTIVHVHGWARALSPSIVAPLRAAGLPAIYTIHEYFLFCPNGGFYNYPRGEACSLKPLSLGCLATDCDQRNYGRKLWRFGRLYAARRWLGMAEAFADYICISGYQAELVRRYLPARVRLHHLSNPVEVEDPGPKADPASGDLIFVGRLSPEKGPALFAEAAARVGIAPKFIGDGPLRDELARRFPQAKFLGWLPPDEARAQMRAARALAFPSIWHEGQPLTVLEAKAFGTPVVVSDGCAGREEIEDGASGLWFKSADVASLAAALERMKDDGLVRRLSEGAYRSYWRSPPTQQSHVSGLQKIYRSMLAGAELPLAEGLQPKLTAEA